MVGKHRSRSNSPIYCSCRRQSATADSPVCETAEGHALASVAAGNDWSNDANREWSPCEEPARRRGCCAPACGPRQSTGTPQSLSHPFAIPMPLQRHRQIPFSAGVFVRNVYNTVGSPIAEPRIREVDV